MVTFPPEMTSSSSEFAISIRAHFGGGADRIHLDSVFTFASTISKLSMTSSSDESESSIVMTSSNGNRMSGREEPAETEFDSETLLVGEFVELGSSVKSTMGKSDIR